ncbi:MAG: DUF2897 family protein [Plesiomonas sp.]|uniref:DUF2897 family protein n=1 Tax=Plesiomonas sp. TaxID=2486279 RepID=UPI003F33D36A
MALLADIFSYKWLIIITVIAIIGGNLALLKATAHMKMPKGKPYPPPRTPYDNDEDNDQDDDNWGYNSQKEAKIEPACVKDTLRDLNTLSEINDASLIKNATTTQQTKVGRKEDHNRNNGLQ